MKSSVAKSGTKLLFNIIKGIFFSLAIVFIFDWAGLISASKSFTPVLTAVTILQIINWIESQVSDISESF
ncbi:MAG: hypothetical protein ACOC4M_16995 [Promethearchaeia archaeon]